jgi:hypothetical protein
VKGLVNWWKRKRNFYVEQSESHDDRKVTVKVSSDSTGEIVAQQPDHHNLQHNSSGEVEFDNTVIPASPDKESNIETEEQEPSSVRSSSPESMDGISTEPFFSATEPSPLTTPPRAALPFVRHRSNDSFQGSLESLDSLVESYWDPEDDGSMSTPVATNMASAARSMEFFAEHVHFLRVQTKPRKVEIVWSSPPDHNITRVEL